MTTKPVPSWRAAIVREWGWALLRLRVLTHPRQLTALLALGGLSPVWRRLEREGDWAAAP